MLIQGSCYRELAKWIAMKKVVTNLKDNGEKCLKWAVIAALLHEDIGNNSELMSKLQHYEGKYNWQGL